MVKKVFTIDTLPGVQRDGTIFDMNFYTDALWVRFQRGRPRKIGGYRSITSDSTGYSRGIYVNSTDGINQVFNGYNNGLEVLSIDNNGIGAGISQFTFTSGFTPSNLNLWQFDSSFDAQGSGNQLLLAHPGQNLAQIDQTVNTPVLAGDISGTTMAPLGQFTAGASFGSGALVITLGVANSSIGAGQTVSGAGIASGTTVVSVLGTAVTISLVTTSAQPAGTQITFNNNVSVSGGVVVLHPYIFVYGDNGLIRNNSAGNPNDWVSADSNETNAASTKIVKGLPVRGGSNAPSGLFWSLDSLIRVSFTPTTVTVAASPQTFYWRYDIITSQSSIMSSQCVIEYDGIYYWIGVDRFLLYNGVVKEIKNTFNQNYFFDNLNYNQRQKVYANKVPRFGEIWWFFPSGDSEECNDCIIYNIREDCWYDAGGALGAYRTAGFFSTVFHYPINAGADKSVLTEVFSTTATTVNGNANIEIPSTNLVLLGQQVIGAGITTISVVIAIAPSATPNFFTVTLDKVATASATVPVTFNTTAGRVTLWQHEIGTDEVIFESSNAIDSYFETSDLGFVAGGPAQTSPVGENYFVNLERIEPDFIQEGEMTLQVTGRPYAQSADVASQEYPFDPNTGKIDMRQQRREIRLRFRSNVSGGTYQMGKVLLSVTLGDVRPFGN